MKCSLQAHVLDAWTSDRKTVFGGSGDRAIEQSFFFPTWGTRSHHYDIQLFLLYHRTETSETLKLPEFFSEASVTNATYCRIQQSTIENGTKKEKTQKILRCINLTLL